METLTAMVNSANDYVGSIQQAIDDRKAQLRQLLQVWMKTKFQEQAETLIDKIPGTIKYSLEDPYMPGCVRRSLHRGIDGCWPDFRQEILWEVQVMIDGDEEQYTQHMDERGAPCCLLAKMRYHLFPYNQGIWSCIRDPFYLLVNLLSIVPTYGIYAFTFLFIFILIDKKDEYQLVYFILSFKGAQFFSWGLVKGIVGFSMYFMCVTFPDIKIEDLDMNNIELTNANQTAVRPKTSHNCETAGPGMSDMYWLQIVSWLLPLVLVWSSLFLLPYSEEKGRSVLKDLEDHSATTTQLSEKEKRRRQRQGGYIWYMLLYDIIVFAICVCLLFLIVYAQPVTGKGSRWEKAYNAGSADWQVQQTLFFCQFIYGLLSIVFVPFNLPFLQAVLTHSVPTAYDEQGRCCKFKGAEKPKREEFVPEEGEGGLEKTDLVDDEEAESVLSKFKAIASGRTVDLDSLRPKKKKESLAAEPSEAAEAPAEAAV